jgi:hypothetical protein
MSVMCVTPRFACEGCGKQYRWKEQFAGRRVKCAKCKAIMIAPQFPPRQESDVELYELVPDSPPRKLQEFELDVDAMKPATIAAIDKAAERKKKWFLPAALFSATLVASGLVYHLMV